jgi:hypothetical protein
MKMRSQELHVDVARYATDGWRDHARAAESDLEPFEARQLVCNDAAFAIGLRVPDVVMNTADADGVLSIWLFSTSDRSMAAAAFAEGMTSSVAQVGDRSLWDEVTAAWAWWLHHARPEPSRFGLMVSAEGQRTWLDDPAT